MVEIEDLALALDVVSPMFVLADPEVRIRHAGRTLRHLTGADLIGRALPEVFCQIGSDAPVTHAPDGHRLQVRVPMAHGVQLTGVASRIGRWRLLNFSFGLGAIEAVKRFAMTNADFAPTDQTVNMLYLAEAKTLALDEFRRLSHRLDGARHAAEMRASTDALTGLQNRRGLEAFLAALSGSDQSLAVLQIDLDYFKAVNDRLGHAAGDHVLTEAAKAMRSEVRAGDLLARTGGDEFTLVVTPAPTEEVLRDMAQRIIARLEQPILFEGQECRISASVGIVRAAQPQGQDLEVLLADADKSLYAAKNAGRGRFVMAGP